MCYRVTTPLGACRAGVGLVSLIAALNHVGKTLQFIFSGGLSEAAVKSNTK